MSTISHIPRLPQFKRPPVAVRRFTVDEYHQMGVGGVLTSDDQVELLEGWIVPKMIHNPQHALAIENGQVALQRSLPKEWRLRVQLPITTDDSEPEPDFAVVRQKRPRRLETHPTADDLALVIEVADSTLEQDRRLKGTLYARAGIPAYWIVNLIDRHVETFSQPTGAAAAPTYTVRKKFPRGKKVPLVIDGKTVAEISVADLLP